MAMNKIERIDREIAKTREKITEYQNKLRGLEAQKTEAENLQIVQLVRSMRLSPHELSAMLSGGGIPGMEAAPGYPAEPADHDTEECGQGSKDFLIHSRCPPFLRCQGLRVLRGSPARLPCPEYRPRKA